MSAAETFPLATPTKIYVPGGFLPKLLYLGFSLLVFGIGTIFVWEPLGCLLLGRTLEARVSEIRVIEPGQPERVFKYRREYPPESNLSITFQHYVSVPLDGQTALFRISVDSRKAPIPTLNVNDVVKVAYHPADKHRLAYAYEQQRTWGAGGLFCSIGLVMLATAIPMLRATGRPIVLDPETSPSTKTD